MCISYGIALYGTGSWSFGNDFVKTVIIFGAENSLSSDTDYCKNSV